MAAPLNWLAADIEGAGQAWTKASIVVRGDRMTIMPESGDPYVATNVATNVTRPGNRRVITLLDGTEFQVRRSRGDCGCGRG